MKIVATDLSTVTIGDIDTSVFEKYGEFVTYDYTAPEETIDRIKDADILLINKTKIGKAEIDAAPNLKYIGIFATGFNIVDVDYAKEKGIVVSNAGQYSTNAVAQHTFALILEIFSRIGEYNEFVQSGGWRNAKIFTAIKSGTDEIYGKTLGIVGYGSIGSSVARIANAFGMNVLVYTRTPKDDDTVTFVDFDNLCEKSDIITLHCPLTDKTTKMFNTDTIRKCKDGVIFINTSRGGVFDEYALAEGLKSGKVAYAALDVLDVEPMKKDSPLFGLSNTVITPHVAWAPLTTRERLLDIVTDNLEGYLKGEPKNVVNK